MDIENLLDHNTCRAICDYFIGDKDGAFKYRTQGELINWLNFKFSSEINLEYSKFSRWFVFFSCMKRMGELDKIDEFFTVMLSFNNIKADNYSKSAQEIANLRKAAIAEINNYIGSDGYELVDFSSSLHFHKKIDSKDLLGVGGFAYVYKAPYSNIVIKRLKDEFKANPDVVSRFKNEFNIITNKLNDVDGIIKAYDYDENEITYTMEYCECNLKDYILNNNLSEDEKIELILSILTIMKEVHKRKVLHRDLSPKNIFIKNQKPIIADFGLGKAIDGCGRTYVTCDTSYQGTLEYCDPRQFQGLGFADEKSDIYSLAKIINFIMSEDSENFEHELGLVTTIATQTSLSARYSSVEEMIDKINRLVSEQGKEISEMALEKMNNGEYLPELDDYLLSFDGENLIVKMYSANFCNVYLNLIKNKKYESTLVNKFESIHERLKSPIGLTFASLDSMGIAFVDYLAAHHDITDILGVEIGKCITDIAVGVSRWAVQIEFRKKFDAIKKAYVQECIDNLSSFAE